MIRTRMAPSPTGDMHVGSMATLLKNYAFAKKHQGKFVLRIEDTDKVREVEHGVEQIQNIIRAYGLDWDEGPGKEGEYGPYIQSERLAIYQHYVQQLLAEKKAYYCFCTKDRLEKMREEQRLAKQPPKYDRHCVLLSQAEIDQKLAAGEPFVVRLKVPENQQIVFTDLIRGEISFNSNDIDDQVLMKSDGYPTYHLAVVIDDHLMNITHIMRGEEWISSTPKHVLLYQAFGWEQPIFAHMPLFLNPDGKGKMSKRKGTVSAQSFLDQGYLPQALLNFFMILGWTPEDQRDLVSLAEYIREFDPSDLSKNSVVFDLKKLDWLNGMYIRKLSLDELIEKSQPFLPSDFPRAKVTHILPLIHERLVKLNEIEALTAFFYRSIKPDQVLLLKKATSTLVGEQLQATMETLTALSDWEISSIEIAIRQLQEQHDWKRNQYFMMIRVAITGQQNTPPLFETMNVLGKEMSLERLKTAQELIS